MNFKHSILTKLFWINSGHIYSNQAINCSKPTMGTPEQYVNSVQVNNTRHQNNVINNKNTRKTSLTSFSYLCC